LSSSPTIISRITALFSNKQRGVPLNPTMQASDEYDGLEHSASSALGSSSASSSPLPTVKTSLLGKTDKQKSKKEQNIDKAKTYGKKFAKFLTSHALNLAAPHLGQVTNLYAAASSADHIESLKTLFDEPCDAGKQDACQGLVAFVIHQKRAKLADAICQATPGVSSVKSAHDKIQGLMNKVKGESTVDLNAQARLLVDHAKECHVALAIYAELVYGALGDKKAWANALKDVDDKDLAWGLSDEDPDEPAAEKLAKKLTTSV
jgi:hypothetical protein